MGAILFEETIYDPNRERERTSYLGNEGEHLHALDEYMLKPSPKTSGSIFNFNNAANDFKLTRTNSTTTPLSNMAQAVTFQRSISNEHKSNKNADILPLIGQLSPDLVQTN